jgi:cell fate regulator YaaT (PSP1 superfamily)
MLICGISFKDGGKIYYFLKNDVDLNIGDYAIVETEKGEQLGKVMFIENKNFDQEMKNVLRKANQDDYNKYLRSLNEAHDALEQARIMVKNLNLNMQLVDASYTFDHKQLLINFIADERIDFRELVKQLAAKYKTRIELHQMGVRDKAREIGGLGQCGRPLCCANFLNHIDGITINMAKNQNIALNPTKINGSCGRLLCCLSYEDECYCEYRKGIPNIGSSVTINKEVGKVISIDIPGRKYKADFSGDIREINVDEQK